DTLARLRRLEIISSPKDHYNSPNWGGPTHPCYLRFVITREGETRRIELTLDWPYYRDKLRPIDANFAIFMRGFPRDDLPELTMRYSKRKSGVDVAKLVEVAQLLAPHFQRVIAPDGTVVKAPGAAR
ncbi:MAG: hypothetical protein KC503_01005, partial [Myxococcales bacterium]|nr:hypothetical protein [Myxococcales bacterium]